MQQPRGTPSCSCSTRSSRTCLPIAGYLSQHGVEPGQIDDFASFDARVPLIDKANYLSRYPLAELCRKGQLESCDMIAVSSGSTGRPTFWPRFVADERTIARRFEQAFYDSFRVDERRTLAVVCFALGTWVGGLYTAACCRHLAARGYPLTVIAPGNNKAEILRVVGSTRRGLRPGGLAGLPAVPQGRHRLRRRSPGVDLPSPWHQAGHGRRSLL